MNGILFPRWSTVALIAAFGLVLLTACSGGRPVKPQTGPDAAPAFKPATSEVAQAALSRMTALYVTRGSEIAGREVGGRFRLAEENEFVPADLAYVAVRIDALLDTSRPLADRLSQGVEAATALIAGYRTTEMSEFGIAAHDILDYVRAVAETPGEGTPADFTIVRLTPLEQQLNAIEIACSCR